MSKSSLVFVLNLYIMRILEASVIKLNYLIRSQESTYIIHSFGGCCWEKIVFHKKLSLSQFKY